MWEFGDLPIFDQTLLSSPEFLAQVAEGLGGMGAMEAPSLLPTEASQEEEAAPLSFYEQGLAMLTPEERAMIEADIANFDVGAYQEAQQGLLSQIAAKDAEALARAEATGASNINYYVNPVGGADIIPGSNAMALQLVGGYNPEYLAAMQTYGSRNDQTNPNDVTERSTFYVNPTSQYRLVDASGNVLGTASNPAEVRTLVDMANAMSEEQGKKANWDLQQSNPAFAGWETIAKDDPNTIPTSIKLIGAAMLAATGAGLAQPGGLGGIGAGASNATVSSNIANAINTAYTGAQAGAAATLAPIYGAGATAGATAGSAAGGLIDDIIVNAIIKDAPGVAGGALGSAATSLLPSVFDSAQLSNVAPTQAQPSPAPVTYTPPPEEIIATAIRQPASTAVSDIFPAVTGGISNTLLDQVINQPTQTAQTQQPAQQEYTPPPEEIVLTAPQNILPPAFTAPEALAASAAANALGSTVAQSPDVTQGMTQQEIEDVTMKGAGGGGLLAKLTANMGLTDYLTAASLLGSGVSSLFGGGGGGAATAVPYVSPFGAGVGFGTGRDMRVNPNIADYERYAFGPEASFFAPEYSGLVSQPAAPANPMNMQIPNYNLLPYG